MSSRMLHLITVGTSIVRNAAKYSDTYSILEKHGERLRNWAVAHPDSYWDKDAGEHARVSSDVFRDVLAFVTSDPRRASAELNSLFGFIESLSQKGIGNVVHDVVLYPTDTGVSVFCARIIYEYLRGEGLRSQVITDHSIGDVEVNTVPFFGKEFWRGLLNLILEISKYVVGDKVHDRILANLTAGFKPEVSFLLLISSILGIDTAYYIHESMKQIIEIPIIELQLTPTMEKLLEKILETKNEKLSEDIARITDRLGLSINGTPIPEARKIAEILLKLGRSRYTSPRCQ